MADIEILSEQKLFDGRQIRFSHQSALLKCKMVASVYLPPQANSAAVPAVYWLSGLTCSDENFSTKAGAQRVAAELGLALVIPDTSPRGPDVADDPSYDLGQGAGFYVNATEAPWAAHYQMYDYIVHELPALVEQHFPLSAKRSLAGHSMGGHGALVIGLREPSRYQAVSAFAPICQPTACAWGQKAFSHYLGENRDAWQQYDACALLRQQRAPWPILVDQGTEDSFYPAQLQPEALVAAAAQSGSDVTLRLQPGYDHSYYFISSFIESHLRFHATGLNA